MLAGTQQSVELKLALDQEQQKSKKLEESMRKLDEEMRRTDELLYQMIPKQVADRLRRGENPIDTCEVSNDVSISLITNSSKSHPLHYNKLLRDLVRRHNILIFITHLYIICCSFHEGNQF
jgi:hypothetical protein